MSTHLVAKTKSLLAASTLGLIMVTSQGMSTAFAADAFSISKGEPQKAAIKQGAPRFEMAKISGISQPVTAYSSHVEPQAAFQTLYYAGSPKGIANNLTIEIGLQAGGQRYRQTEAYEDAVKAMKNALPGVKMTVDVTIRQNGKGQYGVATGKFGPNGACVYAWQAIWAISPFSAADTTTTALLSNEKLNLPSRVTLVYCDPQASAEDLARLMTGLSLRTVTSSGLDLLRQP